MSNNMETDSKGNTEASYLSVLFYDVISSPIHLILTCVCLFLVYKIYKLKTAKPEEFVPPVTKPKFKKRNMTLEELKEFDGVKNGTILISVNGNIYDVTRGASFYGPDGPYGILAGRDATRALATFSLDVKDVYDDISDLNLSEMDQLNEWEMQFQSKYDLVGKLIRPGEPVEIVETDDDEVSTAGAAAVTTSCPMSTSTGQGDQMTNCNKSKDE